MTNMNYTDIFEITIKVHSRHQLFATKKVAKAKIHYQIIMNSNQERATGMLSWATAKKLRPASTFFNPPRAILLKQPQFFAIFDFI